MLYIKFAAAWLAAVHPALPWVLLTVALWLAQYATRKTKLGAVAWETMANLPFPVDVTPGLQVLRKLWQALPGTLAGGLAGAFLADGDYAGAALGALSGFGASAKHEVWKYLKFVPYVGATASLPPKKGEAPPPPKKLRDDDDTPPMGGAGGAGLAGGVAAALCLALSLMLTGCGLVGGSGAESPKPSAAEVAERAPKIAFDGAVLALELLDEREVAYLDGLERPTQLELEASANRFARMKRARTALALARDWLEDDGAERDEGRKALASATTLLLQVVDELEADGVRIPAAARAGLAAASAYLGASS